MHYRAVESTQEYLARLETDVDWRAQIEAFADDLEIDAAWFTAMGAVQDAELWYYDQAEGEYQSITVETPHEVAACVGNVSLLDGDRFAHTHAVLSDRDGTTIAGHLNRATTFAGELHLRAFEPALEREYDDRTQLDLWL